MMKERYRNGIGKLKQQDGYYIVEGAIFLPIFIIAVVTIAFLMKIAGAGEVAIYDACDEAHALAVDTARAESCIGFSDELEERIETDYKTIKSSSVKNLRYMYSDDANDGLISFDVVSTLDYRMPFNFDIDTKVKSSVKCRAWIGKENAGDPFPFSEMEKDGESETVWVFPQSGTRYHSETCTFVANKPREMILSDSLKDDYSACKKCDAAEQGSGSIVYCYVGYGDVYHTAGCRYVDKYITSMDKDTAEEKGYAPCKKCGGK